MFKVTYYKYTGTFFSLEFSDAERMKTFVSSLYTTFDVDVSSITIEVVE